MMLMRNIFIREDIELVHGHQGTSTIVMMVNFLTTLMKIPYIHTEHSLYDFGSKNSIELNNLYKNVLKWNISKVICVSNTVRENYILRTNIGVE